MRIEICGNIAAGKTTLCSLLSIKGFSSIFENFEANPFFHNFYIDPPKYAFETELSFLLQHFAAIKSFPVNNPCVCDFSILQDLAYADINLKGDRHNIFKDIASNLLSEIGHPHILIYIDCDIDLLIKRIRARSRSAEASISSEYLYKLNNSICNRFESAPNNIKKYRIGSTDLNFEHIFSQEPLANIFFNS